MLRLVLCAALLTACPAYNIPAGDGLSFPNKGCGQKQDARRVFASTVDAARSLDMIARWPPPLRVVLCVKSVRSLACVGARRPLKGCTYGIRVFIAGKLSDWRRVLVDELIVALANAGALRLPVLVDASEERAWRNREDVRRLTAEAKGRL